MDEMVADGKRLQLVNALIADSTKAAFLSPQIKKTAKPRRMGVDFKRASLDSLFEALQLSFNTLSPREIDILKRRFGLFHEAVQTLEAIGNRYGISRERVRQITQSALRKLRQEVEGHLNACVG